MAEATRRKIYEMLVAERMMVQGFHYPLPSVGHIEKSGSAIAKSRCRGIRPSERTKRDTGRPSAGCLRLAQMSTLATAARRAAPLSCGRFRLSPRSG
jgi:hypothetical protein